MALRAIHRAPLCGRSVAAPATPWLRIPSHTCAIMAQGNVRNPIKNPPNTDQNVYFQPSKKFSFFVKKGLRFFFFF